MKASIQDSSDIFQADDAGSDSSSDVDIVSASRNDQPSGEGAATAFSPRDGRKDSPQFRRLLGMIRKSSEDGRELNLRRQLEWLCIEPREVFALQTVGPTRKDPSYLALVRSVEEALSLTAAKTMVAMNRWGKAEVIRYQGVYIVANRLVGRIDELFEPGKWAIMPEGVITDARIVSRRHLYLDLDTQRRDQNGSAIDLPISATREELHRTIHRSLQIVGKIVGALRTIGIVRPASPVAYMMSGNGVHLWIALANIPECLELRALIRELLAIFAALFDNEISHVDTSIHDAKRIGPLAGTVKRKGINKSLYRRVTFNGFPNPHRLTQDELRGLVTYFRGRLTAEQRSAVAKTIGASAPRAPTPRPEKRGGLYECNGVPIREVAARLGIDPNKPICPGCGSGGSGSDVAFLDDANVLNCKHARCSSRPNRTPVDLVALIAFGCQTIKGTKGVSPRVVAWFSNNFGVGGRK